MFVSNHRNDGLYHLPVYIPKYEIRLKQLMHIFLEYFRKSNYMYLKWEWVEKCSAYNVTHVKPSYKLSLPWIICIQHSNKRNLTYYLKWNSVMEIPLITKDTTLRVVLLYRHFPIWWHFYFNNLNNKMLIKL